MRLVRLISLLPFTIVSLVACGGGDDPPVDPDAAVVPDAEPADPDAAGCTTLQCGATCVEDPTTDEMYCGDCETRCTQTGSLCMASECQCPPDYVPATPTFLLTDLDADSVPGVTIGFGAYPAANVLNVLIVGVATEATEVGVEYELTEALGVPLLASGYNVNPSTQTADAYHRATAGTIVFDAICAGGIAGRATGVTFSAVESPTAPGVDREGCNFDVAAVAFAFGATCP
jgi:hypothetical protein